MEIITSVRDMQSRSSFLREEGKRIGFVPTMGYLHQGHISLVNQSSKDNDIAIVSIYVNPTQFVQGEDFKEYPRNIERDKDMLTDADILFLPSDKEIYPAGFKTYVNVNDITERLCGLVRPGHFQGVATIVTKLFNIVKPHHAYFGAKDYQQLQVIRRLTADLNIETNIIGMPIVREEDGLAMSSRNRYLNSGERQSAVSLYKAICTARELFEGGEKRAGEILSRAREIISKEAGASIDYLKICDPETLRDIEEIKGKALFALAVRFGKTRLIDNTILVSGQHSAVSYQMDKKEIIL